MTESRQLVSPSPTHSLNWQPEPQRAFVFALSLRRRRARIRFANQTQVWPSHIQTHTVVACHVWGHSGNPDELDALFSQAFAIVTHWFNLEKCQKWMIKSVNWGRHVGVWVSQSFPLLRAKFSLMCKEKEEADSKVFFENLSGLTIDRKRTLTRFKLLLLLLLKRWSHLNKGRRRRIKQQMAEKSICQNVNCAWTTRCKFQKFSFLEGEMQRHSFMHWWERSGVTYSCKLINVQTQSRQVAKVSSRRIGSHWNLILGHQLKTFWQRWVCWALVETTEICIIRKCLIRHSKQASNVSFLLLLSLWAEIEKTIRRPGSSACSAYYKHLKNNNKLPRKWQ